VKGQLEKYAGKLAVQRLSPPGASTLLAMDDELYASVPPGEPLRWEWLFDELSITGLVFCRPAPFGAMILDEVARGAGRVLPGDCETRTFLHDIPVADPGDRAGIARGMRERKGIIVRGEGILAHGAVTLEQAFVACSSIFHSVFVKYFVDFHDLLRALASGAARPDGDARRRIDAFARTREAIPPEPAAPRPLATRPATGEAALAAMDEAGKETVRAWLVDSFFGNVSFRLGPTLYISQTASSLDELPGCIDPVPLDGSSSAGITASSELPAHLAIVEATGCRAILHGHPKFCVVMSMLCDERGACRLDCYTQCPRSRRVAGVPVVIGEIGAGGIARTVPAAIPGERAVVVFGHGLFACGMEDFNAPFAALADTERDLRRLYFTQVDALLKKV